MDEHVTCRANPARGATPTQRYVDAHLRANRGLDATVQMDRFVYGDSLGRNHGPGLSFSWIRVHAAYGRGHDSVHAHDHARDLRCPGTEFAADDGCHSQGVP